MPTKIISLFVGIFVLLIIWLITPLQLVELKLQVDSVDILLNNLFKTLMLSSKKCCFFFKLKKDNVSLINLK